MLIYFVSLAISTLFFVSITPGLFEIALAKQKLEKVHETYISKLIISSIIPIGLLLFSIQNDISIDIFQLIIPIFLVLPYWLLSKTIAKSELKNYTIEKRRFTGNWLAYATLSDYRVVWKGKSFGWVFSIIPYLISAALLIFLFFLSNETSYIMSTLKRT